MNMSFRIFIFLTLLFVMPQSDSFAQGWLHDDGDLARTKQFESLFTPGLSETIQLESYDMDTSAGEAFLLGDVLGNGSLQAVSATFEPLQLIVFDVLTQNTIAIPLNEPFELTGTSAGVAKIVQLIDYDDQPGMEALVYVGNRANQRPLHQIVSPRQQAVIAQFDGIIGEDVDGDGEWTGTDDLVAMFKSPTGRWKALTRATAGHSDYKPRSINIWDIETGALEEQFHTATPPGGMSFFTDDDGVFYIINAPFTPSNWIRVDGERIVDENGEFVNVSEELDGILVEDDEAYDLCLAYDDRNAGSALELKWYNKRGELMSGSSLVTQSSDGAQFAVTWDYYIRQWDAESTGAIHVYDLLSGDIVVEYFAEPELSFRTVAAIDGQDQLYALLQEEPVLNHYDVNKGLLNSLRLSDDSNARVWIGGIADMNGDGAYEVIIEVLEMGTQYVRIYSQSLELIDEIETPIIRDRAIGDADRDGYPEFYSLADGSLTEVHVIEYQAASACGVFHHYR